MNILTAKDLHDWDAYTMAHEPIASIDLMERAASACFGWITKKIPLPARFQIFCGRGNNGGDGVALARMLHKARYHVDVYALNGDREGSADFETNRKRWEDAGRTNIISSTADFPPLHDDDVVIDALVGTGLKEPLHGLTADLAAYINRSHSRIISIDLPSGLFTDDSSKGCIVVEADATLSFQCAKLGLLLAENGPLTGELEILDIGLHPGFLNGKSFPFEMTDDALIKGIYRPRKPYAHKGTFGHALLLAGSYGKMGAAVLAARACLHAGSGLLTAAIPRCGYTILQTALPEAMTLPDREEEWLAHLPEGLEKYNAVGIGPGIGTADATQQLVASLLNEYRRPLVIDADALNCLAKRKELLAQLPPLSILTPHPKEFDRLFGEQENEAARIRTAIREAAEKNIVIVLKGAHTLIASPQGKSYFNSTGNAGLAKGGSGDVLTGIITALVAQGYEPAQAAILGVYLHGLAADMAVLEEGQEALTATGLTNFLGQAFLRLAKSTSTPIFASRKIREKKST